MEYFYIKKKIQIFVVKEKDNSGQLHTWSLSVQSKCGGRLIGKLACGCMENARHLTGITAIMKLIK